MRAPSILAQCLPGLLPHDKNSHGISTVPERDLHIPSPAVEILPSKNTHPYKYAGENVDLQGLNIFKVLNIHPSTLLSLQVDFFLILVFRKFIFPSRRCIFL
uniref:Amelotin n=1 Tax=Anthurium amnicola TaxID=1678845 RepID=A0A1D1YZL2_9ARAE